MSPTPFPNTRWTLLQKLREGSEEDARAAHEALCRAYWTPLYAVARYGRMTEPDAQDAVQGFFVTLLRRDTLAKADAEQGKLRNLLLKSFSHYCLNEQRKEYRIKRGEGAEHVPLHDIGGTESRISQDLHAPGLSAEKLCAREWARAVLDRSLAALCQHYTDRGQAERFTLLQGPLMQDDDAATIEALATRAGLSPGSLRSTLHRMRAQYRERIERELAVTLDTNDPAVIQQEVGELFRAFD
jgi:DNA-directed RNA polymerase specialized sigma24 family protein